ncbi:MAG: hypothetical protein IKR91_07645 [Alloprevotella sp.]|nr:hypothetical protein [Alloprevotella sp.]
MNVPSKNNNFATFARAARFCCMGKRAPKQSPVRASMLPANHDKHKHLHEEKAQTMP